MSDPLGDMLAEQAQNQPSDDSGDPVGDMLAAHAVGVDISADKPVSKPVKPDLWQPQNLVNQLHQFGSGTYHSIVGGYKGLAALPSGPDAAAQAVQDEQAKTYIAPPVDDPTMPKAQQEAIRKMKQMPAPTALGDWANKMGAGPGLSTALAVAPAALASFMAPRDMNYEPTAVKAQNVVNQASAGQSMGAAGVTPDVQGLRPELQEAIAKVDPADVHTVAMNNHLEAEQHGVQLMKGQATRDPVQFSEEQNSTHPDIRARLNVQNGQLVDAIDNIRQDAAPTTVGNDHIENGQTVVDALKTYDQPIKADIQAKYKALVDANSGNLPLDTGQFVNNVEAKLAKQYLTDSLPPAGKNIMRSLKAGEPMDFEGFEAARTRLAEAQRQGGSEAAAAGILRNELEQLPLSADAAKLKGLADTARSAARARFQMEEADPAYAAAIHDDAPVGKPSALADTFLDKYALRAPKANVDLLMDKLDTDAKGAVSSHTLNAIRKAAVGANGDVLPSGYNRSMLKYGPKLDSLVEPEIQDRLESLGRVITNAKAAPPGDYVNYSKSGVIMNAAKGFAEDAVNKVTFGMGGKAIKNVAKGQFAKEALAPGAGIQK